MLKFYLKLHHLSPLKSLKESYDSTTPMGDLFYRMMSVWADTEKCLRRKNTLEGLRITKEKEEKGEETGRG